MVVPDKAERVKHFHNHTVESLAELVGAAGMSHPKEITADHIMIRNSDGKVTPMSLTLPTVQENSLGEDELKSHHGMPEIFEHYWNKAAINRFGLN